MSFKGKTILITGGTSGIGRALAKSLCKDNLVIVTGTNEERLERAVSEGLHTIKCDQTNAQDIEHLVTKIEQHYSQLNVLINNAGVQFNYDFSSAVDGYYKIEREINTNLTGSIAITQMLLPLLSAHESWIINVTSGLGWMPKNNALVYSASKAGLQNFTQGLRRVLKNETIKVVEFVPPVTDTSMTEGRDVDKEDPEVLVTQALEQLTRGRSFLAPKKIRLFRFIQKWMPELAYKIIN